MRAKPNRCGFSLVEIMLVVSIFSLLSAFSIPNLIRARETSQYNRCMANVRLIREAIDQWATENNKASNDRPRANCADCLPYLRGKKLPVCKEGESYTLSGTITNLIVNCSVHGDFAP